MTLIDKVAYLAVCLSCQCHAHIVFSDDTKGPEMFSKKEMRDYLCQIENRISSIEKELILFQIEKSSLLENPSVAIEIVIGKLDKSSRDNTINHLHSFFRSNDNGEDIIVH